MVRIIHDGFLQWPPLCHGFNCGEDTKSSTSALYSSSCPSLIHRWRIFSVSVGGVWPRVVEGEQEWRQRSPLWSFCATYHQIRPIAAQSHVMWPVYHVSNPWWWTCFLTCPLASLSSAAALYPHHTAVTIETEVSSAKSAGERIIRSQIWSSIKLQRVKRSFPLLSKVGQDLHLMWCEGSYSTVVKLRWCWLLWY